MKNIRTAPDLVVFLDETRGFVVTNVFSRTFIAGNAPLLNFLSYLSAPRTADEAVSFLEKCDPKASVRDLSCVSAAKKGLFSDPTNMVRDGDTLEKLPSIDKTEDLLNILEKRNIITGDFNEYQKKFSLKENMFDEKRVGNFHQQLGKELMARQRVNPEKWWADQKFLPGCSGIRDNLYKFIQLEFYEKFFTEGVIKGKKVLDVGCWPGYYSNYLASKGAHVLGIDPNPEYIKIANENRNKKDNVSFEVMNIGSGTALEKFKDDSFDIIIFQDALLFYFVPYDNKKLDTKEKVLSELKRALKKDGALYVIDPNGIFWLMPWFGDKARPFTILTEYRDKWYGVTPNLSEITETFHKAGLLIKRIMEPDVSDKAKEFDERGYWFSKRFPLWWVFELVKR